MKGSATQQASRPQSRFCRELAGRVRAERPEVGVVFISGYAPDASWLDDVPGAVFLPKPFTPIDLLRATGKAIARAAKIAEPVAS